MANFKASLDLSKFTQLIEKKLKDPEFLKRVLVRATLEIADRVRVYPAEGPWNSAPGTRGDGRWYQRLFGPRWSRKDGTTGGRNTSQQLQRSWKSEIQVKDVFTASVYTDVPYAVYLYDPKLRVDWAASHGWKTADEIQAEYSGRIGQMIAEEATREIKKDD